LREISQIITKGLDRGQTITLILCEPNSWAEWGENPVMFDGDRSKRNNLSGFKQPGSRQISIRGSKKEGICLLFSIAEG